MSQKSCRLAALTCGVAAVLSPAAFAQNPNSGIAPSGQELTVEITCPGVLDEGDTSFKVSTCATLGAPSLLKVNVLYVLDLSGSMTSGLPGGPNAPRDANGDGVSNQFVDAAVLALVNLNASLGSNANIDVGIVGFADGAAPADASPVAGNQVWISPPDVDQNALGGPDMEQVIRSARLSPGRFLLFNPSPNVGNGTDYGDALIAASNAFALQPPGEANIVFFISDGQPGGGIGSFLGPLNALIANHGAVVNAFGIGAVGAAACNPGGPLDVLASNSGGTCAAVIDPTDLIALLPSASATTITKLILKVNGNQVAADLVPDANEICLDDIEIIQELDLFGPNTIEATAMTADGLTVTATKELVKTACLLYVGFEPDNTPYVLGDLDTWYVKPRFSWNVTETSVPTFHVPNNPALLGKDFYFQVLMHNQWVFPQNAVQMSNGIKVTIGGGATPYGGATGIWSWLTGSTLPGGTFTVHFNVLAM